VATYSDADLQAIRAAIASGVLTVRYDNREVTYRSMSELLEAETRVTRAVETPRRRQSFGYTRTDW